MSDLVLVESAESAAPSVGAAPVFEGPRPALQPAPRDWSNVVFAAAFCEEARRAYEQRADT